MSRNKHPLIAVLACFILVTSLSTLWFWFRATPTIGAPEIVPTNSRLNVLIIGVDDAPGQRGRSDSLMLASFDPKTGDGRLLSIPRDTYVEIPGRGKTKVNHAHAYGGVDLTLRTVSNFLNMPIRHYVKVDLDGFRRLVDAIGGVPIHVEKPMRYSDYAGNLHIRLSEGFHVLNGEQAEHYVRYRHTDSDIHRAQRQQKFIVAAAKQVLKPSNLLRINELIRIGLETVQTNLTFADAFRYLPLLNSFQPDKIQTFTVEGRDAFVEGVYYWVPNKERLQKVLEEHFYEMLDEELGQFKISVQVGHGDMAHGELVAQTLRQRGFSVAEVGAADHDDYRASQVISTRDNHQGALAVARALNIPEILRDNKAHATADVVLILGKDMRP